MNYIFGVPTERHILYQVGDVLPWMMGRLLPWKSPSMLTPLYSWNKRREQGELQQISQDGTSTEAIEPDGEGSKEQVTAS